MSPLTIALACAASAEAFNLVVDLYTWTTAGERQVAGVRSRARPRRRIRRHRMSSRASPSASPSAPALLRMLTRVRSRLEVGWEAPVKG